MQTVSSSFKKLDVFGSKITLNYQGDILYRTSFGGIMAISLVSFLVILFFSSVLTLIKRSKVTYTSSVTYDIDPGTIEVGGPNSMIAIKYDQTNFLKAPWMNITFEYRHYSKATGTLVKTKTPVPLEPCTVGHFSNFSSDQFNFTKAFVTNSLSDYLCLPKGKTYKISGQFTSDEFYFIKFILSKCSNSSLASNPWHPTCDSPAKIAAGVSEGNRVVLYFSNNLVSPSKTSEPVMTYLENVFFNVQPQTMYTTANIMLNEQIIQTDHSIFPLTDITTDSYIAYAANDYKQSNAVGNFSNYQEIFFLRSPYTTKVVRSFTKIDEVISYMGGFCQIFILFTSIIVSLYNDYIYTIELANRLYDFDIDNITKQTGNGGGATGAPGGGDGKSPNAASAAQAASKTLRYMRSLTPSHQNSQQLTLNLEDSTTKEESLVLKKMKKLNRSQPNFSNSYEQNPPQSENNFRFALNLKKIMNEPENLDTNHQTGNLLTGELIVSETTSRQDSTRGLNPIQGLFETKNRSDQHFTKQLHPLQEEKEQEEAVSIFNQSQDNKKEDQGKNKQIDNQAAKTNHEGSISSSQEGNQDKAGTNNNGAYTEVPQNMIRRKDQESVDYQNNKDFNINSLIELHDDSNVTHNRLQSVKFQSISQQLQPLKPIQLISETNTNIDHLNSHHQLDSPFKHTKTLLDVSKSHQTPNSSNKTAYQTKVFLEKELMGIIQRNRSLGLNFKYILNKLTFGKLYGKEEQVQLLAQADQKIRQDLDIFMILDRLKELDKLKELILTAEQQTIFNFFPKPLISVKQQTHLITPQMLAEEAKKDTSKIKLITKKTNNLKMSLKSLGVMTRALSRFKRSITQNKLSDYQQLYQCYEKLANDNHSEVDTRLNAKLIKLLGSEMQQIFEVARQMKKKSVDPDVNSNNNSGNTPRSEQRQIQQDQQQDQTFDTPEKRQVIDIGKTRVKSKFKFEQIASDQIFFPTQDVEERQENEEEHNGDNNNNNHNNIKAPTQSLTAPAEDLLIHFDEEFVDSEVDKDSQQQQQNLPSE